MQSISWKERIKACPHGNVREFGATVQKTTLIPFKVIFRLLRYAMLR